MAGHTLDPQAPIRRSDGDRRLLRLEVMLGINITITLAIAAKLFLT